MKPYSLDLREKVIDAIELNYNMKPYSLDLREKVIDAIEKGDSSVRKVAQRFGVSKNFVQRLVTQKRTQGHILPQKQGGSMVSPVMKHKAELMEIFERQNDATLAEYCELLFNQTGLWVSQSTMCRTFQRLELPWKKRCDPAEVSSAWERAPRQNAPLQSSQE